MNISLSRNRRRWLRAGFALIGAIGAGTLAAPDFVPGWFSHDVQQVCVWLVGSFMIVNPVLDLGASDAKGDEPKA